MQSWLKILYGYREGLFHMYYYGLTPRFIIGASQIPIGKIFSSEKEAYASTLKTFEEMNEFNSDGLVVVSNYCGIHKGPVLSLTEGKWTQDKIATTFEEIWNRYGDEIIKGEYQINKVETKILEAIFN